MNTNRLTDLRIIDELRDALADARLRIKGMVDAGDLQAAVRRAESAEFLLDALRKADAERTEKLRALSLRWKEKEEEESRDPYGDDTAIRHFTEQLDEILEEPQ